MKRMYTHHKWIPVVLAAGIFVSCSNDIDEIKALTEESDLPVQTVEHGTFHYTSRGKLSNTLEATILERFENEEDPRIEVSGGFKLTIYDSLQSVEATLTAENGTFWEQQGRLIARNDVELQNMDGDRLNTEELIWVQDSDLVYTNKHVIITTEEATIKGKGLVTDSKFKKRQIKQVSGEMFVDDPTKEKENGSEEHP